MALIWMDGFEGFTASGDRATLDPVYDYGGGTGGSDVGVFSPGRLSGSKALFNIEGGGQIGAPEMHRLPLPIAMTGSTLTVGVAYRILHNLHVETELLQFLRAGAEHVTIKHKAGNFEIRLGDIDGTLAAFGTASCPTRVWYFLECQVVFHATAGSVTLRVNGQEVASATNVNTAPGGVTAVTHVYFGGANDRQRCEVDDLYICDGSGSTNTTFLGDTAIKRINPSGNGTTNDFVGSDADSADNYLLVDEDDPDGDTTYVGAESIGDKDLYAMEDAPSTPSEVKCLSVVSFGKKTDSGAKTYVHVVRSGTTEEDSDALTPGETYAHQYSFFPEDPDAAAAWDETSINALEAGVKIAS